MDDVIEMAECLGLPGQRDGENERDFRIRIAAALRANGSFIEAQEILTGRRYDDPGNPPIGQLGNPLTGVAGAIAGALEGIDYGGSDEQRVEDDAALGAIALSKPDPAREAIARAFDLLGPEAGMDFLGGSRKGSA